MGALRPCGSFLYPVRLSKNLRYHKKRPFTGGRDENCRNQNRLDERKYKILEAFYRHGTNFDDNGKQLFMFILESFHGWNGGAQR